MKNNNSGAILRKGDHFYFSFGIVNLKWIRSEDATAMVLSDVRRFCSSLTADTKRGLAFQISCAPNEEHPALGRLKINFIGCTSTKRDAIDFLDDLGDLLVSLDHIAEFVAVQSEDEVARILDPVKIKHVAEVRQRQGTIEGSRSHPIGFRPQALAPSDDGLYFVSMFAPVPTDLSGLCERMQWQEDPVMLRIVIRPARATDLEHAAISAPFNQALAGDLSKPAEDFIRLPRVLLDLYPLCEVQILIASSGPISEVLANSVGTTLSGPLDALTPSSGSPLVGAFEVSYLTKSSPNSIERRRTIEKAVNVLDDLAPRTLATTIAPTGYERLHRLFPTSHLACVIRLPIANGPTYPGVEVEGVRRIEPDFPALPTSGVLLGVHKSGRFEIPIRLSDRDRGRHVYIVGQTGTGKSTLITNMVHYDMAAGRGLCLIDPHGDLVDSVMETIPDERRNDVVVFDPVNPTCLMSIDPLRAETEVETQFLVQDLSEMFYELFDPGHTGIIGPRFEEWLRMGASTLIESAPKAGAALFNDIPRLFTDTEFLKSRFQHLTSSYIIDFWTLAMGKTSDFHKSEMLGYFTSKWGTFSTNLMMRQVLGADMTPIPFANIMEEGKILLIKLPKGMLGEVNSRLLGYLIMSKLWRTVLSRSMQSESARTPFSVYVDEFQNFKTSSFDIMLSEGRKFGLELVLAHQFFSQLPERVKAAVLGNVGTKVVFRVGPDDGDELARHFAPEFDGQGLTYIPNFTAACLLLASGRNLRPFTFQTLPPPRM